MRVKDIDQALDRNILLLKSFENIDLIMSSNDCGLLDELLTDITSLSSTMVYGNGDAISGSTEVGVQVFHDNSIKRKFLKKIDTILNIIPGYHSKVRPFLKHLFRNIISNKYVSYYELIKFNNEHFIKVVYHSLLFREPDAEGEKNCLENLRNNKLTKLDIINIISSSDEGRSKGIYIKGLKTANLINAIRRIILSIPFVGYLLRLLKCLVLLPKYFYSINQSFLELLNKIQDLQEQLSEAENAVQQTKADEVKIQICVSDLMKRIENDEIYVNASIENTQDKLNKQNTNLLQLHQSVKEKSQLLQLLQNSLSELQTEIAKTLHEQFSILDTVNTHIETIDKKIHNREVLVESQKQIMDQFYLDYNEQLMLDSREEVMQRESIYLKEIEEWRDKNTEKANLTILDLGCGEGEWLELLQNNGYSAYGIDNNERVVEKVHSQHPKLKVILSDAFNHLESLSDDSVDLITMFHMIEHMDVLNGMRLLRECRRVLKYTGMLIIETPNPQNLLIATYYFRLDPTHHFILPHELLEVMVRECKLEVGKTIFLNPLEYAPYKYKENDPISNIIFRFNIEQSYAVLALKGEGNANSNYASNNNKS